MTTSAEGGGMPRERRVWQQSAGMALLALACEVPRFAAHPAAARPSLAWAGVLLLFALTEVAVIHLPSQRSSHSHTLREIPAIAGLAFLAPDQYVTAYVLGAGAALVVWSRLRGLKLCFNLSMYLLEATLGSLTYHAVLGGGNPIDPRGWAAAAAAVLVTDLVSAAAVTGAISLTEGAFDAEVLREALRSGVLAALVNTCVALLTITLVVTRPAALPLLAAVPLLLVPAYRVYVALARRHTRMQMLYRFVGSTGQASEPDDVVAVVLSEAAELLRATRSELAVCAAVDADGGEGDGEGERAGRLVTWDGTRLETAQPPDRRAGRPWWERALSGEPVHLPVDAVRGCAGAAVAGREQLPRDGVAVPLRRGGEVVAVLAVSDRMFEAETFTADDVQLLEALAAHAAVALERAQVVDRLRQLAAEREHEARHDALTGLPNRRAFAEAVDRAMSRHSAEPTGAVLMLDVDGFKDVNDTLGHAAGDALLVEIGRRLEGSGVGLAARLGGDEFAVLVAGVDLCRALERAHALRRELTAAVSLLGVCVTSSVSIGVAEFAGASCSGDELIGRADVALYAAKAARSGVEAYRPADGASVARRLALATDLPGALANGGIELWYQPQARAADGRVTGFEALLRWPHPRLGMVPPPEVVAVAQRTGLMPVLTSYVLDRALRDRGAWAGAGHDLDVAVNVTPTDVLEADFAAEVEQALQQTSTPPGALVLELTETDEMDQVASLQVLTRLAARGVRISVDDFGTGYSSLAYLDRLPLHEVKIDQSFVFRLEREASAATIIRATVTLAHDLGFRVVAEGVENAATRSRVAEIGCDLVQGYELSRPMPAAEVLPWLTHHAGQPIAVAGPSSPRR